MIDTHAHIDTEAFDEDREEMIQRAFDSGVEKIIIPAIEPAHFDRVIKLAEQYDNIFCSIGVHPHNAAEVNDVVLDRVRELAQHEKVIAIGEIGLDYFYDFTPKDVQIKAFERQIIIAKEKNLPVIIHNRESDNDLLSVLKRHQDGSLNAVLHCFSSDVDMLKKSIDMGFHVSFTGNITFKKTNLGDVVREVPLDRVMIETDSPYMAPVPFRGKRNEPAKVLHVAEKIAEYKSITTEEVILMTSKTTKNFFNLALLLLLFLTPSLSSFAQNQMMKDANVIEQNDQDDEEDEYEDQTFDEETEEYSYVNPYKKGFGFGALFGTNTIVQTQYEINKSGSEKENPVSYEGVFALGGSLNYGITDYLIAEVSYTYSKNSKIAADNINIEPSIYHVFDLSTHWIPNPASRINFFGTIGMSYYNNSINEQISSKAGINFGLGFIFNIKIPSVGLVTIVPQWKINFLFGRENITVPDYKNIIVNPDGTKMAGIKTVDATSFFSIPKVQIIFYPNF